ncbi:S16 family serine protease [Ferrimonas kyonanensis]|uniref:S16 family serine protease n=1 Tax=Ferrimonas kyonanensis TaxID=364763 RepID=UPI0012EC537B|nr:S16 family serine protease [Ferrimonas kyonanensis]
MAAFPLMEYGQLVNRQSYRLLETQLFPQFSESATPNAAPEYPALLLGQSRLIACWQALVAQSANHLYLSTTVGLSGLAVLADLNRLTGSATLGSVSGRQASNDSVCDSLVVDRILSRQALYGHTRTDGATSPGLLGQTRLLAIPVEYLLDRPSVWWPLKQALETGHYSLGDRQLPVQCQVVIIGSAADYDNLNGFDSNFSDIINLYGECQPEMEAVNADQQSQWMTAANGECRRLCQRELSTAAATRLARHASRLVEHQEKLSLSWSEINKLFKLLDGGTSDEVSEQEINAALALQSQMHNALEESSHESIREQMVLVQTQGQAVGQINGLTVVDYCGHSYGEPARITTTVHYGDGEVADVERKSDLGGNIHAKGMMILSACLYRLFGRDAPLHLNANIVFEQSYQTIDGDSASLAEYCSLISAIADAPIAQNMAMTGAVDQFGNVQAIGGINQKIEGFFRVCNSRGLTGDQGVILPSANMRQLNLSDEVIQAVLEKRFHLYQVDKVEQALELVSDIPLAEADKDNQYPEESLYGKVQLRLAQLVGAGDEPLTLLDRIKERLRLS